MQCDPGDVLFEKIKRLTKAELVHDYNSELAEINDMLQSEEAKNKEMNYREIKKLQLEIETLKISNMALAKYIKDGMCLWIGYSGWNLKIERIKGI